MAAEVTVKPPTETENITETEFVKVDRRKRSLRKRKLNEDSANDMDTAETSHSEVKRPSFPPISAEKMAVGYHQRDLADAEF